MQTLSVILAMASILTIASTAPSPAAPAAAAKATGYIKVYFPPDCAEIGPFIARQISLPQDKCIYIESGYVSFKAGTQDPKCPTGTKPTVTAFEGEDCTGQSLGTPELAANGSPSACMNADFHTGLDFSAQSAKFSCVKN